MGLTSKIRESLGKQYSQARQTEASGNGTAAGLSWGPDLEAVDRVGIDSTNIAG
jgi:hypothetical protein